jgi:lipoyl synthase
MSDIQRADMSIEIGPRPHLRKPPWLKQRIPSGATYHEVHRILRGSQLHTVCEEARCPNLGECFSRGTATFLILGDRCTRNCKFCAIAHGPIGPPDPDEPYRVVEAVQKLGLRYVVVTSVTRDDLSDGGAGHFARTVEGIRRLDSTIQVEVLVPDFHGSDSALKTVLKARPNVLHHNVETVPRLYPNVRPGADYKRSLGLLKRSRELAPDIPTKSGIILGLGEFPEELLRVFSDLVEMGCAILTLGQYLQPSKNHLAVERFVPPEEFEQLREVALELGFIAVASGPFVRSSYHAGELYRALRT